MPSPPRPKSASTAGLVSKRGDLQISDPIPTTFTHNRGLSVQPQVAREPYSTHGQDDAWLQAKATALRSCGGSHPHLKRDAGSRQSLVPSVMTNTMSPVPSKSSLVQRKPSGLKATIKRMFGSKRQPPSMNEAEKEFHFSDPGNLIASTTPLDGHDPNHVVRPLTRSSPFGPSAESPSFRDRVEGLPNSNEVIPPSGHRRRNTLPSLVFSDKEAQNFSKSLGEYINTRSVDQSMTGSTNISASLQKRSRSAEALTYQRRKKESINSHRRDRALEGEVHENKDAVDLWSATKSTSTTSTASVELEQKQSVVSLRNAVKPMQSFDFGLSGDPGVASLEDRVNTLEVKMFDFEYAIAKLQGANLSKPVLPHALSTTKSSYDLRSTSSQQSISSTSSGRGKTFLASPDQSPRLTAEAVSAATMGRSSIADTVRPSSSPRKSSGRDRFSPPPTRTEFSHLEDLKALLQDERAARQQMEMQIMDLQREIQLLQAPIYADIRPLDHSMPSPADSLRGVQPTSKSKRLHRSPPINFKTPPVHNFSRFSTDSDAESESGYEELYNTPLDDRHLWESMNTSLNYPISAV